MNPLWQASRSFMRRHPAQVLLAGVGMTAGGAVMVGVVLLRGAVLDSVDQASRALAGDGAIRLEAPGRLLDERRLASLAVADGAPDLVAVIERAGRVAGRPVRLTGVDTFAVIGSDGLGDLAERAGGSGDGRGVVINRATAERLGLASGDRLEFRYGGSHTALTVASVVTGRRALDNRLLMDIAPAQTVLGMRGAVSYVLAPAGTGPWLTDRLPPGWSLRVPEQRRAGIERLTRGLRVNLTALSLLALAVGMFVVFSVFSFLLVQRRRAFAVLRAVGVTGGRLAGLLLCEALLLGALGGLAGLVAGTVLAGWLLRLLSAPMSELYGAAGALAARPDVPTALGLWGLCMAAAVVAAVPVVREAWHTPPGRQLARVPDVRAWHPAAWLGALLAGTAGVGLWAATTGLYGGLAAVFALLVAAALVMPDTAMAVIRAVRRIVGTGTAGWAAGLVIAGAGRFRPALTALGLALAVAAGMAMMIAGFRTAVDDWVTRLLRADAYVTASAEPLDPAAVERWRGLPGVAAVSTTRRRPLAPDLDLVAYALPPAAWPGFEWLSAPAAYEDFSAGRGVLVTEALARRRELAVGEHLTLPAPGGHRDWPVLGVFRDYTSDQGFVALDADAYRRIWADREIDSIGLYLVPGASPGDYTARVGPGRELVTPARVRAETLAVFDRTFRITRAMQWLVGVIALVALVSTLLAQALERGRDYATLRAVGMTRRRTGVTVAFQTLLLTAASLVVSLPAAALVHGLLTGVVQPRAFGWTVSMSWPWLQALTFWPPALLAGALAGLGPAWRIARRAPGPWLRAD